jgi:hypothetical protein
MSTQRRPSALLALLPLLAGLLLSVGAAPAAAHTELVASTPGPGATVNGAARDLTLTFVSQLVPEGSQVVVRDPGGADHADSTSTLGPQARVALRPLTRPGTYTVSYRAVAADGHPITGRYEFRVSPKGAAAARSLGTDGAGTAPRSDSFVTAGPGSSRSGLVIGALGAGSLAVLLVAGARRRPEQDEARS